MEKEQEAHEVRVWNVISVNGLQVKDKHEKEKYTEGEETLENSGANSQDLDHRGFDTSKRKGNSLDR